METTILDCGHEPSPHSPYTTGYGEDLDGKRYCYACCADRDRASMIETGRATLYLVKTDKVHRIGCNSHPVHAITNWPGSLSFPVYHVRKGRHNIAGRRYDCWFHGPDGFVWHAVQYGEWAQIAHCRRTKERAK